ncbi:MAG: ATP-binding protein [Pseudomonadota bacterium]
MRNRELLLFQHQVYPHHLAVELLAMGARNIKPYLALIVAIALSAHSINTTNPTIVACWLSGAVLMFFAGSWFRWRYKDLKANTTSRHEIRRAELIVVLYSLAVGLLWGSSSDLLMVKGEIRQNMIIVIVYLGFCAGASSMAMFGRAHLVVGGLSSLIVFLFPLKAIFSEDWWWLAPVIGLYGFSLLLAAIDRNKIIVSNLLLRDEKNALLEQQRIETERANKANHEKSAFLAAASHDLRQPLHALMLTSHALSLRTPEGESQVLVQRIVEAGRALSYQFNHLMDLSRLESGTYKLNANVFSLSSLLQQVIATHRQVADHRHIDLKLRLDRRLQETGLQTDAALLSRALDNLIDNAIKFSSGGSRVLITARLKKKHIQLGVHDRGMGIPLDQQEWIFKPYVQLNNPTRELSHGIGLGLSIVREAISLLGGQLTLRSRLRHGSSFVFSLDRAICCQAPQLTISKAPLSHEQLRGKKLLLVEDDAMVASALINWAQNWGLRVEHYMDPRKVPDSVKPDLILSDIRLPGERDGIQWLVEWLALWPKTRGLLLSGEISTETDQRAEAEGLLLLSKPADPELLLQTLISMTPPERDVQPTKAAV